MGLFVEDGGQEGARGMAGGVSGPGAGRAVVQLGVRRRKKAMRGCPREEGGLERARERRPSDACYFSCERTAGDELTDGRSGIDVSSDGDIDSAAASCVAWIMCSEVSDAVELVDVRLGGCVGSSGMMNRRTSATRSC